MIVYFYYFLTEQVDENWYSIIIYSACVNILWIKKTQLIHTRESLITMTKNYNIKKTRNLARANYWSTLKWSIDQDANHTRFSFKFYGFWNICIVVFVNLCFNFKEHMDDILRKRAHALKKTNTSRFHHASSQHGKFDVYIL